MFFFGLVWKINGFAQIGTFMGMNGIGGACSDKVKRMYERMRDS